MQVRCGTCGHVLRIAKEHRGVTLACPHCGVPLRVPGPPRARRRARASAPRAPGAGLERTCPNCWATLPHGRMRCPECGTTYHAARELAQARRRDEESHGLERAAYNAGVLGGIVLIGAGIAWFYLSWKSGRIRFYPAALVLAGIVAILHGIARRR